MHLSIKFCLSAVFEVVEEWEYKCCVEGCVWRRGVKVLCVAGCVWRRGVKVLCVAGCVVCCRMCLKTGSKSVVCHRMCLKMGSNSVVCCRMCLKTGSKSVVCRRMCLKKGSKSVMCCRMTWVPAPSLPPQAPWTRSSSLPRTTSSLSPWRSPRLWACLTPTPTQPQPQPPPPSPPPPPPALAAPRQSSHRYLPRRTPAPWGSVSADVSRWASATPACLWGQRLETWSHR